MSNQSTDLSAETESAVTNIMQRLDSEHLFSNDELRRIREAVARELVPVSKQIDYLHAVLDLHCDDATKDAIALFEYRILGKEETPEAKTESNLSVGDNVR